MAASLMWQVPEYGGKQLGTGDYAMLSDDEDDKGPARPAVSASGTYNLSLGGGLQGSGVPPPPPGSGVDDRQRLQVE